MSDHGGGKTGFFGKLSGILFGPLSHHGAEAIVKKMKGFGIEPIAITPFVLVILFLLALSADPMSISAIITALAALSPVWLPLFLGKYFWIMWMHYIRFIFFFDQKMVLLEVQLPAEVTKSPQAMEVFLAALHSTSGETTFIDRIWKGKHRAIWSLEIASNEGRIGFYIRMRESLRNMTEARLYGQYPEAKVIEVDDYVDKIPFNLHEYGLFAMEYQKKPDQPQAAPIKTYPDFKLDMNTDTPEIQVDPITHILELFNTAGPGEYMWTQIIMKARKGEEWYGFYVKSRNEWLKPAQEKIKSIMGGAVKRAQDVLKDSDIVDGKMNALLTDSEKKFVEAIEKQLGRPVFECGIRTLYIAKSNKFQGANIPALVNMFNPVNTSAQSLTVTRGLTPFNYPWQDFKEILKNRERRKQFFFYKQRAYFYVPYDQSPIFMTPEELATIWHFPSSVVKTPSLNRVESRRAEAPRNLPMGVPEQ